MKRGRFWAAWALIVVSSRLAIIRGSAADRALANAAQRGCGSEVTEASCIAALDEQCNSCVWLPSDDGGHCQAQTCSLYLNQSDCCSNPSQVGTGCFWSSVGRNGSGECRILDCGSLASSSCYQAHANDTACTEAVTECESQAACQMTCAGCRPSGMSCSCGQGAEDGVCSGPSSAGPSPLLEDPGAVESCSVMACALCLMETKTCDDKKIARRSWCSAVCSGILTCDEDVECAFCNQPNTNVSVVEVSRNPTPSTTAENATSESGNATETSNRSGSTNESVRVNSTAASSSFNSTVFNALGGSRRLDRAGNNSSDGNFTAGNSTISVGYSNASNESNLSNSSNSTTATLAMTSTTTPLPAVCVPLVTNVPMSCVLTVPVTRPVMPTCSDFCAFLERQCPNRCSNSLRCTGFVRGSSDEPTTRAPARATTTPAGDRVTTSKSGTEASMVIPLPALAVAVLVLATQFR
mmetsp:Transcript_3899/g.9076  ORF Transcript_3899/g.9076 Transcript_3899/m.9076 type:complete len:467 (-) Transcript_3899:139-1539(-)